MGDAGLEMEMGAGQGEDQDGERGEESAWLSMQCEGRKPHYKKKLEEEPLLRCELH